MKNKPFKLSDLPPSILDRNPELLQLKKQHKATARKPSTKMAPDYSWFVILVKQECSIEIIQEHLFHPVRKWRFDFAIIDHKIAIEVGGGVFSGGRHTRGKGFMGDMEKYNSAVELGWKLIRVTPKQLKERKVIDSIKEILNIGITNK